MDNSGLRKFGLLLVEKIPYERVNSTCVSKIQIFNKFFTPMFSYSGRIILYFSSETRFLSMANKPLEIRCVRLNSTGHVIRFINHGLRQRI